MARFALMAHCLLLFAMTAGAQSLGEVAKKEKERRAKIDKEESSPIITEAELSSGRDGGEEAPMDSEEEANSADDERSGGKPAIPDVSLPTVDEGSTTPTVASDDWNEVFAEYQQAYNKAKAYLRFAEGFERHCKDGSPPPPLPPVSGGYWLVNCDSFPEDVVKARQLMRQIQDACHNHARRLGVLPGRARLR